MLDKKITLVIACLLSCLFANLTKALEQTTQPCQGLVVVGDTNWVPYTTQTAKGIAGVGVEQVKQIFAELDISVKEIEFTDRRSVYHGLRLGDIDVLLSMYKAEENNSFLELIEPGYHSDPISVVMRKERAIDIERWADLIGQRGVMTNFFNLEKNFADYAKRYLYIHNKGDLAATLRLIKKRKADYMVGSKAQLEYALKVEDLKGDLKLIPGLTAKADVHMGFSKNSACKAYLPYLRKRLIELRNSGETEEKVRAYVEKALENTLPKDDEKANLQEYDYLFEDLLEE